MSRIRKLKYLRNDLRAPFSLDSPESSLSGDPEGKATVSLGNNKRPERKNPDPGRVDEGNQCPAGEDETGTDAGREEAATVCPMPKLEPTKE